ncbi:hypothetical protein [Arcticibacter sp. MXS-1]|uniref:hypothetical protein n=1 Tax=Arcticibacter sp. MXS-1 TaxID=3341726 RepID=UPI0035A85348
MKQFITLACLLCLIVITTSCAPAGHTSHEYGFFSGLIHGIMFFFALLGKLFGFHVGLYAENNTGFFYWLGFIIGIGGLGGGGASARR